MCVEERQCEDGGDTYKLRNARGHQKLGEPGSGSFLPALGGLKPVQHPDFVPLGSRTVRQCISLVDSTRVRCLSHSRDRTLMLGRCSDLHSQKTHLTPVLDSWLPVDRGSP